MEPHIREDSAPTERTPSKFRVASDLLEALGGRLLLLEGLVYLGRAVVELLRLGGLAQLAIAKARVFERVGHISRLVQLPVKWKRAVIRSDRLIMLAEIVV